MKNWKLVWILSLALCLGFGAVEARGDGAELQTFFAELRSEAAEKPLARRQARPGGVTGEKAYCEAQCGGGTKVSVNCSGSCTAVDRNCPSQRGYVQCNGGSKVYCPSSCGYICSEETPCPGGGSVSCQGTEYCIGGPGFCYVECDGNFQWCPGTEPMIAC